MDGTRADALRLAVAGFGVAVAVALLVGVVGFGDPVAEALLTGVGTGLGVAVVFYLAAGRRGSA